MAFLVDCAIHMSNPSIWRRLSALGLKRNPCSPVMTAGTRNEPRCVVVENGTYYDVREGCLCEWFRDCGTDERMFFALAAMRDDTDQDQVFIYDDRDWNDRNPSRFWFRCSTPDVADDMPYNGMAASCRKATLQELIYHFRGMDDDTCYGDDVTPFGQR